MITYQKLINKPSQFRRFTGVELPVFNRLVSLIEPLWQEAEAQRLTQRTRKRALGAGRKYALSSLQDKLLLLTVYYKSYVTFELLGYLFNLDAANACRLVQKLSPLVHRVDQSFDRLTKTKRLKKISTLQELINEYPDMLEIIIDTTEQGIKKPKGKKKKNKFRSGKAKKHTLKTQVTIDKSGQIIHIAKSVPGSIHDKKLLVRTDLIDHLSPVCRQFLDRGYEGIKKHYPHHDIRLPFKRYWKQGSCLSAGQKRANTIRGKKRIKVEHTFSRLKKFQILSQTYRSSLKNYHHHFKSIASLINLQLEWNLAHS